MPYLPAGDKHNLTPREDLGGGGTGQYLNHFSFTYVREPHTIKAMFAEHMLTTVAQPLTVIQAAPISMLESTTLKRVHPCNQGALIGKGGQLEKRARVH